MDIDYKKYHRDSEYLENELLFKNIFLKRFVLIKKFIHRRGKVLDVGCTNGIFLDLFKDEGWETWGVEPSENGEIAKSKGHKVISDYFESSRLSSNYFDLVIMNHTLEHMDNPKIVLKKVNSILKKEGILFIDVPNFGGLGSKILKEKWPYLLSKEHKHQFTFRSLKDLVKSCGFTILSTKSRSGLFEFADPFAELWQSLVGLKKRFFEDILLLPYSFLATLVNQGDSMSVIGRKI